MKQIGQTTGASMVQVKSYKAKDDRGRASGKAPLQARDANGARTQLDLALRVGEMRDLTEACGELGVLRIEARLYAELHERLQIRASYLPPSVDNPTEEDLQGIVESAGFDVALPPERWGKLS